MLAMLKKPLWAHLPQVFVLGLSPNTRLLFLKNNLSSVGHEILELLFLKSNNRDVSFSTVISLFRTRKKCVFGAILVFKFPYNPHCIKNFKKNFFFFKYKNLNVSGTTCSNLKNKPTLKSSCGLSGY